MPSSARSLCLVYFLYTGIVTVIAVKWPLTPLAPVPPKVPVETENFPFWDPFKITGFNASVELIPSYDEARRRAPGYLVKTGLTTSQKLFLPPKITTALSVGYLAARLAKSDGDMKHFMSDMAISLFGSPGFHIALLGTALRVIRFRRWRQLLVKTTIFRFRYQLLFQRIQRPRWVAQGDSALEIIVRDTVEAARSAQGLLPDLCYQAAVIAGGCRLNYWSDLSPVPAVEKGWGALWDLDRILNREFGRRAKRVRPGDGRRLGPGFLGWRVPCWIVFKSVQLGVTVITAPFGTTKRGLQREKQEVTTEVTRTTVIEGEDGEEDAVFVEVLDEIAPTDTNPRESEAPAPWRPSIPGEGPLILLHNVTSLPSLGSTLTKSYHAVAELPYGDGRSQQAQMNAPILTVPDNVGVDGVGSQASEGESTLVPASPQALLSQPVIIKRNLPRQLQLAADDIAAARKTLRRMAFYAKLDLDLSGLLMEVSAAVARTSDLRVEAESIGRIRASLARAGMLGSTVGVPEVVSCAEVGPLARHGLLVITALKGIHLSNLYVMEHAAARGGPERSRYVHRLFAVFGQLCLSDGFFPSNPTPENLLYMHNGQVGLTDLSSVSMLSDEQRRGLCRLYRTMAELKGVDAASPSPAAERKARLAMEGVGLVIDLPPAGGIMSPALSVEAEIPEHSTDAEIVETNSWTPSDTSVDTSKDVEDHGGEGQGEEGGGEVGKSQSSGDEDGGQDEDEVKREIVVYGETDAVTSRAVEAQDPSSTDVLPSRPRAPLTHVMLLRGLFDTRREEALDLIGRGGDDLLRSMSVRRLPQAVVPVLRMVSNLRNVCAHLEVDRSLLPQFSRAASKGLSWRLAFTNRSRGGGTGSEIGSRASPLLAPNVHGLDHTTRTVLEAG